MIAGVPLSLPTLQSHNNATCCDELFLLGHVSTRADPTEQATHPYSEDVSLPAQRSREEKERDENAEQSIIARFG